MQPPAPSPDERRRLDALRSYELLDTLPEQAFDDLTALAAQLCDAPMSMISLVDEKRQWFKSTIGLPLGETPRDISFCAHAILQPDVFVVSDASIDPRFSGNPFVTGNLQVRFYAGAPLIDPDGHHLGTLCLMDRRARQLTRAQEDALRALGRQTMAQINLRRQARELYESDMRLRLVTDNARIGLVILNEERRYIYANGAYLDILGLPSEPVMGRRVAEVLGDVYESQVRSRLDRAFAGVRIAYELKRPTPHGDTFNLVRYEPTDTPAGRVVIVVIADITEQKAAAMESRRLAAIVESSDDAIIGKDLDGVVTSWNRGAEKVFGYRADEMVGASLVTLVPPDRKGEEGAILARIRRGESVEHLETVRRAKDGRLLNVSITSSPIRDDAGVVVGASKVARDMTSERRDADRLREREEQLRLYAEHSPAAVAMLDRDMRYLVASRRWMDDFHLGDQDIVGRSHYEVFSDIPDRWLAIHQRCLAGAIEKSDEDPFERADGRTTWLRWEIRPWHKSDRSIGGIIMFCEDITARKDAEASLRTLETQFQQAQKMEAIGRLAGGIAHDFNNLLTAILGYSDLLMTTLEDDDPLRGDVVEIHKAGTSAAALTRQLLAFSRKEIIEPSLLDVNEIITSIHPMMARLIGEDVKITLALSPGAALIVADRGQVEQVLMNLIVNARDAMPRGGVLTIQSDLVDLDQHYASTHFATTPGPYVALTVTDTGVGIRPEVQAHLFEPFFTTKEVGKGTGLGLATVHGIVTRAGGSVGVYSEVGKGTSFKVYFPRADAALAAIDAGNAGELLGHPPATILVVEDAPNLRELARRLLEPQGYTVLVAAAPEEAIALFDTNPSIALLLTDVVMPGVSGPELASHLTAQRPDLKVVYMSGYTEEAIVQHGVLKSGVAFIHKPFTAETLGRKVREALER